MIRMILSLILLTFSLNAEEIYATFTVEADKSANLAFISSGIVEKVNVDIGSAVKKGEILAQLENSDIKAMLDVSRTTLKYAQKDFDRQVKIKKLIDEARFDAVANKYESAKNQLAYQEALFNKTFLKAPFNGVIYAEDVEVGDAVSGMMLKTVFKIQSLKKRKLILEFDQKYNRLVKAGDIFKYSVDGDEKIYTGEISKVYPQVNAKDRKMRAEVKAEGIMPGLFGDGYILIEDKK
jgi:RND family efflux transporter MFP subunit